MRTPSTHSRLTPPAANKDEYHELKLEVSRPGLTAHINTGYYDQPYYSDEPDPSIRRVTVAQLEQELSSARGQSDGEVARQVSNRELTEQVSDLKLASRMAELQGKKARQGLTALADASAFLLRRRRTLPRTCRRTKTNGT